MQYHQNILTLFVELELIATNYIQVNLQIKLWMGSRRL
jgi:hypothetical protein